jgi:hypothetical protein
VGGTFVHGINDIEHQLEKEREREDEIGELLPTIDGLGGGVGDTGVGEGVDGEK